MAAYKHVSYSLELTEDQAILLRAMVQNPLNPQESFADQKLREYIFNSLTNIGVS